jgi:hypothetical protein
MTISFIPGYRFLIDLLHNPEYRPLSASASSCAQGQHGQELLLDCKKVRAIRVNIYMLFIVDGRANGTC